MQRAETKNSKNKDTFDKMKTDIRLLKDEFSTIETMNNCSIEVIRAVRY